MAGDIQFFQEVANFYADGGKDSGGIAPLAPSGKDEGEYVYAPTGYEQIWIDPSIDLSGDKSDWVMTPGTDQMPPGDIEAMWDSDITDEPPDDGTTTSEEAAPTEEIPFPVALTPNQQAAWDALPAQSQSALIALKNQSDASKKDALIKGVAIGVGLILGGWWLLKRA